MDLIGKRVEIAPNFTRWIRGDRFGVVVGTEGSSGIALLWKIRMDKSQDVVTFADTNLRVLD